VVQREERRSYEERDGARKLTTQELRKIFINLNREKCRFPKVSISERGWAARPDDADYACGLMIEHDACILIHAMSIPSDSFCLMMSTRVPSCTRRPLMWCFYICTLSTTFAVKGPFGETGKRKRFRTGKANGSKPCRSIRKERHVSGRICPFRRTPVPASQWRRRRRMSFP